MFIGRSIVFTDHDVKKIKWTSSFENIMELQQVFKYSNIIIYYLSCFYDHYMSSSTILTLHSSRPYLFGLFNFLIIGLVYLPTTTLCMCIYCNHLSVSLIIHT